MNNRTRILVVGASGATGKHVVEHLLEANQELRVIVRSTENLSPHWKNHAHIELTKGSLLDFSDQEMEAFLSDCKAVISCLGHNLTFKGMYGHPRKLVTDATRRLTAAYIRLQAETPLRFILMNTTGNRNRDLNEPISFMQRVVIQLLRWLLPPHRDNEMAADYLRTQIGKQHSMVEWVAVRPDNLINEDQVSDYELFPSPVRSALFDAGKTSRINVAHFMAGLATDSDLWTQWKGQMPVIYNK